MILVTGGSRGIGRAVVEGLVAGGAEVAFTYRSSKLEAVAIEKASGGAARGYYLDLSAASGPDALVDALHTQGHRVSQLVNNAGLAHAGLLAMLSDRAWEEVLDVNLNGVFRLTRAVLPDMIRQRGGAIVNMASVSALRAVAGQGVYAASKAALLALTRALAREMGRKGIRVNAVAPGLMRTDLTQRLKEEELAELRRHECLEGGVSMDSVVAAVRFLLSEGACSITGHCLVVDAGASI